jgi:hypothetical protein
MADALQSPKLLLAALPFADFELLRPNLQKHLILRSF